jgi:cholesterol oxidase
VFSDRWPQSCRKAVLLPYYEVARHVLGARPIPTMADTLRQIPRTILFQKVAGELGRKSKLMDINVFFGNDFSNPLPRGVQDKNRYGALQTSCVYCAECDVGCNYHAKNTLDLNYLFRAEQQYGAEILTEHIADWIVPVDSSGKEDPAADGSFGYRVNFATCRDSLKIVVSLLTELSFPQVLSVRLSSYYDAAMYLAP